MKLDTHVHTTHSGYSTIRPLSRVVRESSNSVEGVYRNRNLLADLVARPALAAAEVA